MRQAREFLSQQLHRVGFDLDQGVEALRVTPAQVTAPAQITEIATAAAPNVGVRRVLAPEPRAIHVFVDVDDFAGAIFLEF